MGSSKSGASGQKTNPLRAFWDLCVWIVSVLVEVVLLLLAILLIPTLNACLVAFLAKSVESGFSLSDFGGLHRKDIGKGFWAEMALSGFTPGLAAGITLWTLHVAAMGLSVVAFSIFVGVAVALAVPGLVNWADAMRFGVDVDEVHRIAFHKQELASAIRDNASGHSAITRRQDLLAIRKAVRWRFAGRLLLAALLLPMAVTLLLHAAPAIFGFHAFTWLAGSAPAMVLMGSSLHMAAPVAVTTLVAGLMLASQTLAAVFFAIGASLEGKARMLDSALNVKHSFHRGLTLWAKGTYTPFARRAKKGRWFKTQHPWKNGFAKLFHALGYILSFAWLGVVLAAPVAHGVGLLYGAVSKMAIFNHGSQAAVNTEVSWLAGIGGGLLFTGAAMAAFFVRRRRAHQKGMNSYSFLEDDEKRYDISKESDAMPRGYRNKHENSLAEKTEVSYAGRDDIVCQSFWGLWDNAIRGGKQTWPEQDSEEDISLEFV